MSRTIRALVADDEAVIRDLIGDILAFEMNGASATGAATCSEAVERVRHEDFDVAFLDVCMKDGDGVRLVHAIREISPATQIYMMTGYAVEDRIEEALAEGAAGAIYKPFKVKEIVAAVHGIQNEVAAVSE